jgi:hypothetical protein
MGHLPALASAALLLVGGCAPDGFSYDESLPGPGGSSGKDGCDIDGCPPECPIGSALNAEGACEPVCHSFRTPLDVSAPAGLATDETRVYAAGTSDGNGRPSGARFYETDACQGASLSGVVPVKGTDSRGVGVAFVGATPFAAGWQGSGSSATGFIVELEPATLLPIATTPLSAPSQGLELRDLSAAGDGVWVIGQLGAKSGEPWVARFVPGGSPCGAAIAGGGEPRAIGAHATGAIVVTEKDASLRLLSVDASSCSEPSCGCQPTGAAIEVAFPGASVTRAHDVVVDEGIAYVIGDAETNGASPFGCVLAVHLASASVTGFYRWDPSPAADALFAAASDGQTLFAGGMSSAEAFDVPASGSGAVVALALPLANEASALWTSVGVGPTRVQAVATTRATDAGVFIAGTLGNGSSLLARCTKLGC